MKKILSIAILLFTMVTFAQNEKSIKFNEDTNLFEATYFHDNGTVSQTGFFNKEGKLQGEWLSFDLEGVKTVSAKYDNGVKVGKWFFWNDNKLKEVDYTNNLITGVNEWSNKSTLAIRE
ncbi:nicotinic acid mononucleotide adenyltransferase [Lacinutrix sp. C3R15]|uniref:toxin-antitoxin system YwqK family antitoxin n=1 Tax=Flavobacteriaceae TaxID=49546 RepID=UPI001C0955C8|nr:MULTISPECIES: nicotinic acid mononucleotide adenyltransferase [Flavobacteriaceae]MBU2938315.1 nicotinic acid mononucleotide adenyltransferase [Lacinutrix sp. C3R15]MDO6621629.1 nicotinic acid mononucleotide adenyltransferase [Oceanihabitans sp. 1_MG-2023]